MAQGALCDRAHYVLERGWDEQPRLSARTLPHLLQGMLGKLLLVNMGELELETSSMMTTLWKLMSRNDNLMFMYWIPR